MLRGAQQDRNCRGTQEEPPVLGDADRSGSSIRFKVEVTEDQVAVQGGFRTDYKVIASLKLSSIVVPPLADGLPVVPVRRYARLVDEGRRDETCIMGLLVADVKRLDNQARFVHEMIGKVIVLANRPQRELMRILREREYDPDPLIVWAQEREARLRWHQVEVQRERNANVEEADLDDTVLFSYLLDMPLWCLTQDGKARLTDKMERKKYQLNVLREVWRENNSVRSLATTTGEWLGDSERPSDNGPTSGYSRERSSRSTAGIPSTSASSTVHDVAEQHRYRNAATRGGNHSRIVNEETADDSGHTATAAQGHQAVNRNRLGKRVHRSSGRNTQQHRLVAFGSNRDGQQDRPTTVSTRSNDSPAGTSRQDQQNRNVDCSSARTAGHSE